MPPPSSIPERRGCYFCRCTCVQRPIHAVSERGGSGRAALLYIAGRPLTQRRRRRSGSRPDCGQLAQGRLLQLSRLRSTFWVVLRAPIASASARIQGQDRCRVRQRLHEECLLETLLGVRTDVLGLVVHQECSQPQHPSNIVSPTERETPIRRACRAFRFRDDRVAGSATSCVAAGRRRLAWN